MSCVVGFAWGGTLVGRHLMRAASKSHLPIAVRSSHCYILFMGVERYVYHGSDQVRNVPRIDAASTGAASSVIDLVNQHYV